MAVHEDKRRVKWLRGSVADRVKIDGRPSIGSLNQHWLHMRQNATGRATYPQYYRAIALLYTLYSYPRPSGNSNYDRSVSRWEFVLHYTVLLFYFYSNPYLTSNHCYV